MRRTRTEGGGGREREPGTKGETDIGGAGRKAAGKKTVGKKAAGKNASGKKAAAKKAAGARQAEGTPSQNQTAERLLLEQSIARVVNGQTGLLVFLDMLLHDAEQKDLAGFLAHAEGYLRRAERLEPLFARYKALAPRSQELALYRKLLKLGKELEERVETAPSGGLSDKVLDAWRKRVPQIIDLYGANTDIGGDSLDIEKT